MLETTTVGTALKYVDTERQYPCSNCGTAPIPCAVALGKIQNLVAGAEIVRRSL